MSRCAEQGKPASGAHIIPEPVCNTIAAAPTRRPGARETSSASRSAIMRGGTGRRLGALAAHLCSGNGAAEPADDSPPPDEFWFSDGYEHARERFIEAVAGLDNAEHFALPLHPVDYWGGASPDAQAVRVRPALATLGIPLHSKPCSRTRAPGQRLGPFFRPIGEGIEAVLTW